MGLESMLEGGCRMGDRRRSEMQEGEGGMCTEGGTRIEARGDTYYLRRVSHTLRNFRKGVQNALVNFFFRVFPMPRIFKDIPNCFEVPPEIDNKKPKLNQTKIKLK